MKNQVALAAKKVNSDTKTLRISALDGLRGLAIILVMLNHISHQAILNLLDPISPSIAPLIVGSGKTGVSILFLLSGFLIATYYPAVPNVLSFWQKRYTRIFPPVVAICVSLGIIFVLGNSIAPYMQAVVAVGVAGLVGAMWRLVQRSPNRRLLGKRIFLGFFSIQLCVVFYYLFMLTRTPPQVYYSVWPHWLQEAATVLVNSTMTLPFGVYIGELVNVFWSLTAEVMFYLLYPILLLPLLRLVLKQSIRIRVLIVVLIFPFIYGLALLFPHVLGFDIVNISFSIYFVAGMIVARLQKTQHSIWIQWQKLGERIGGWSIILSAIVLLAPVTMFPYVNSDMYLLIVVLFAIPLTLMFGWTLVPTAWSNFMQHKRLVYLGTISYSLYLTHTLIITMWDAYFKVDTVLETVIVAVISLSSALIFGRIFYELVEKPYFNKESRLLVKHAKATTVSSELRLLQSRRFATAGVLAVFMFLLLGIWLAYRPPIGVFNTASNVINNSVQGELNITTQPMLLKFTAAQQNLGMIYLHLKQHSADISNSSDNAQTILVATIYDDHSVAVNTARYAVSDIGNSLNEPIGMPVQRNSQGRVYTLSLALEHPQATQGLSLMNDPTLLRPVYITNKQAMLQSPALFATTLEHLAVFPLQQFDARLVIALTLPLFVTMIYCCVTNKKRVLEG